MPESNKSFYVVNKPFNYDVNVKDKEDGVLGKGISPERVAINIDYLAEGYDKVTIAQGHRSADAITLVAKGKTLLEANDCMACHSKEKKSVGPTYRSVALKYKGDNSALDRLSKKVISGGSGVWGEVMMSGHPQLSPSDATEMVKYILSLSDEKVKEALPTKGNYTAKLPEGDKGKGVFIVRAAYQDKGVSGLPALKDEKTLLLRNSKIDVTSFDVYDEVRKVASGGNNLLIPSQNGAFLSLKQIDLAQINEVAVTAMAPKQGVIMKGGTVEIRLDSPQGILLGKSEFMDAGSGQRQLKAPIKLPDNYDKKLHDVYIVFVNPSPEQRSLMLIFGIEFKLK